MKPNNQIRIGAKKIPLPQTYQPADKSTMRGCQKINKGGKKAMKVVSFINKAFLDTKVILLTFHQKHYSRVYFIQIQPYSLACSH